MRLQFTNIRRLETPGTEFANSRFVHPLICSKNEADQVYLLPSLSVAAAIDLEAKARGGFNPRIIDHKTTPAANERIRIR